MMTNRRGNVLYIGFTNDLKRRLREHKKGYFRGFTKKYQCNKLVYFEEWGSRGEAVSRERQLKRWKRKWKMELIKKMNPEMIDLSADGRFSGDPKSSLG